MLVDLQNHLEILSCAVLTVTAWQVWGRCALIVAAVLFFTETSARVNGSSTCTQTKCQWTVPSFQKDSPHLPIKEIDFSKHKKTTGIDNDSTSIGLSLLSVSP